MSEASIKAQRKYDAAHKNDYKPIYIKLHKEKDNDILKKLADVESMQGYIKDLIRKDIK